MMMSPEEIARTLAARLKRRRLEQRLTQADVARRAGLFKGTITNLESKPHASSLETIIRVALALGLSDQFEQLFVVEALSIRDLEKAEEAPRRRARRGRST
jgi:transcriptional regulator with XRE-family HTH domain